MFVLNAYSWFLLRNTGVDSDFTQNFWGKNWRLGALHHMLTKRRAQSCTSASHVFHCRMPSAIEWGKNSVRSRWWWCVCAPGPRVPVRPRGPPMSQDPSYCSGHKYIGYKYTKKQFYANTLKHQQCQRICFIIFLGDLVLIHILSRYSMKISHSARALFLG